MTTRSRPIIRSGLLLAIIALLGTALLAGVNKLTHERIVEQEKRRVLQQLNQIIPIASYNNDLLEDVIRISATDFYRQPAAITVYRARLDGRAVSVIMIVTAPDGYNGDIRLLIGIDTRGTILGVRVISHRETPGLGDPIDADKSDWILGFTHKSLRNPNSVKLENSGWAVEKDGGEFDQFTGATISPRAVVRAVHSTLLYFRQHQKMLFSPPPAEEETRGQQ